jgi:aspartyl/glutamyl-tRNA(Asn/Gln) amidotransferase C subunit
VALSPDEVRHVARLARLALTDDEVASLAPQLSQILGYAEQVGEVAAEDVEPTTHPFALRNVTRPGRADVRRSRARRAGRRTRGRAGPVRGAPHRRGGGVMELTQLLRGRAGLPAGHDGEVSAREVVDAHLDRIAATDGVEPTASSGPPARGGPRPDDVHAFLHVTAAAARPTPTTSTAVGRRGAARSRSRGSRWRSRTC